ncbi:MAG: mismatch-specific DNA-glycosylase [Actinobacteria bacterium]|nr:mismatch-specific DNA-glycosylase [Actinomycetota bacterium]
MPLAPHVVGIDRPDTDLPLLLADLHADLEVGTRATLRLEPTIGVGWGRERAADLLVGAGFGVLAEARLEGAIVEIDVERLRSLPDSVAPGMRLLTVGLNPSPASADSGVGYHRPGNRFWPAVLAAGLVSIDRDPGHALVHHGLGMTDLVRRTTARADEVDPDEFREGFERVERLCAWLRPAAACFVGLGGWRIVADRKAVAGVQDRTLGGVPVYVMPSTSGLNAHSRLDDLTAHFRAAGKLADRPGNRC